MSDRLFDSKQTYFSRFPPSDSIVALPTRWSQKCFFFYGLPTARLLQRNNFYVATCFLSRQHSLPLRAFQEFSALRLPPFPFSTCPVPKANVKMPKRHMILCYTPFWHNSAVKLKRANQSARPQDAVPLSWYDFTPLDASFFCVCVYIHFISQTPCYIHPREKVGSTLMGFRSLTLKRHTHTHTHTLTFQGC